MKQKCTYSNQPSDTSNTSQETNVVSDPLK